MVKDQKIPKEEETIAARRAVRVAEKIRGARAGLTGGRAWWSNQAIDIISIIGIFVLNLYLIYPFFGQPSSPTTFSGPVVPIIAKAIELFGVDMIYAFQIVNIIFFLTLPLSLYLFVKYVSERRLVAILTVLFISLPFFPFAKLRVDSAFFGVDSPHVAGISLIPLALYGLLVFLRRGGLKTLVIAAVSSALVVLTSPFAFITYALFAGLTAFSEMLLGRGRLKFVRTLIVFFLAAGLTSFWYNPAFFYWMMVGPLGEGVRQTFSKLLPVSFFVVPALGAFGFLLFDRKPKLQPLFLASFYTVLFGIIVMAGGGFFPFHPSRYTPELGIAVSFLLAIVIVKLLDYLKVYKKIKLPFMGNMALSNLLILFLVSVSVLGIIFGRDQLLATNKNVLGLWTEINKGEIWVERDKFDGIIASSGYLITATSMIGLAVIGLKSKANLKRIN